MSNSPRVSVILPIYNSGELLRAAIDSVLQQTFTDFELIAINDGSTDTSQQILEEYNDPRLRVYKQENQGLIGTLNRGLELSQGELIARVDHDDTSVLTRLEKQVAFLDNHPDHGMVGTTYAVQVNDDVPAIAGILLDHESLKRQLLFKNPFGHGTVMFRKSLGEQLQGNWYAPWAVNAEDFELWSRVALVTKVANLPEPLYFWRDNPTGISSSQAAKQKAMRLQIAKRNQKMAEFELLHTLKSTPFVSYKNEAIEFQGKQYAVRRGYAYVELMYRLAGLSFRKGAILTALRLFFVSLWVFLTAGRAK